MTPEAWAALGSLVQQFGLPLAILAGFAWLILTGKLVTGQQFERMSALYERERTDRLAAEAALAKRGEATADFSEAIAQGFETVLDRLPSDPYDERLRGRARGR